jgi:hypothetical protein
MVLESSKNTVTSVYQVLEIDRVSRVVGIQGDLFSIDDIKPNQKWDYSLPTLVRLAKDEPKHKTVKQGKYTTETFVKAWNEKYPLLKNFNYKNICIAGGSVCDFITMGQVYGDFDFFVYGIHSAQEVYTRIEAAIDELVNTYKTTNNISSIGKSQVRVIRTKNCITLFLDDMKLQFIFRIYKTMSEVIHAFDIGACSCLYNGKNVYLTSLGKFSHEYALNIVDTTKGSTSYENRLEKYFDRGFNIVLPALDVNKLKKEYLQYGLKELCVLPRMAFSYDTVGNVIRGNVVRKHGITSGDDSGYSGVAYSDICDNDMCRGINFKKLLHGKKDLVFFGCGSKYKRGLALNKHLFEEDMILKMLQGYMSKRIDFNTRTYHFGDLDKCFPNITREEWAKKIVIEEDKQWLQVLIQQKAREMIENYIQAFKEQTDLTVWIQGNPVEELLSPMNPIVTEESVWYGEYYCKKSVQYQ